MLERACSCPAPVIRYSSTSRGSKASAPSTYRLEYHGRWEIDLDSLAAAPSSTRAVLLVSPNNPTGSYVTAGEVEALTRLCHDRGWALIVDEVFADYALDATAPLTDLAADAGVLAFSMGGRIEVARPAAGETRMGHRRRP